MVKFIKKEEKKKAQAKRFSEIEKMSQKDKANLIGLFNLGWNVEAIANRAQADGYFKDWELAAVVNYLTAYQATVLRTSTDPLLSPIDARYELTLLIHEEKERLREARKDKTLKQSEKTGIVKNYAGLLKLHHDMSFDLGILQKAPQPINTWAEPIVDSPGRRQFMYNQRLSERIEKAEEKFFKILESDYGDGKLEAPSKEKIDEATKKYDAAIAALHQEFEDGHHTIQ